MKRWVALIALAGCAGPEVNDTHSALNRTRVDRIVRPTTIGQLQAAVRSAPAVSIAGGRHSMGGQQFGEGTVLIDMTGLNRVVGLDAERGIVEVEAGILWPDLMKWLEREQKEWAIAQKQTGGDRFTIGGSLASNIHSRGLTMKPIIVDVESFTLVDASGALRTCSRTENRELFRLAIGGYGLFGVFARVKLRLMRRQKLERVVEIRSVEGLIEAFEQRIADGYLYGDFQFSPDERSEGFLRDGVFACYRPVDPATPIAANPEQLNEDRWRQLIYLAHVDRAAVYRTYVDFYRSTHGQIYWSDTHQLSVYVDGYHQWLDEKTAAVHPGSEMITEIYVPHEALERFLDGVRVDFVRNRVQLIYGTIRLIEKDNESFLAWAKERYACIIFNLHVEHTPAGIEQAAGHFRRLIDRAIQEGGSYYLTYHRWATRRQVETCYPQFADFLRKKLEVDPQERFQSEWYRHYRRMFN